MDLKTIRVVYLDGLEEDYVNAQTSVMDGVLHVYQYQRDYAEWHIPLTSIRKWHSAHQHEVLAS